MDFFNHPYYRTGKNVTRLIGTWPHQKYWERRLCGSIIIFLCTSQFIAEVLGVIVYRDDKEVILESITPFMIDIVVAVKYVNAVFNLNTIMRLLDRLKDDWSVYANEEDKRILDENAYIGQLVTYGYIVVVYVTTAVFITEPLIPKWMNMILQLNATVPNKYPVPIYWHRIDMEKYFYPILCYESICIVAILTITVANDSMFIIFLQHACALFTVVGRQLRNLPSQKDLEKSWEYSYKFRKTNDIQYDYYVMCIKNHKRAIEILEDMYVWCFGVVIAINMPIMSVTAVQITTQSQTIQQTIKYGMFACAQIIHLFFDCYLSQRLTDNSTAIDAHIKHSNWYEMTLKTQKLVTMVTLRSQEACKLTAGKLVLLSMQTFGVIVKTSASYFTVMLIKLGEELHNVDGIIECIPMIGLHTLTFGKYFNWIFNAKKMKKLLSHIQKDWDNLQFEGDLAMLHKFSERGRVINVLYSSAMFSILGLYLASPSVPILLDKVHPLNQTRDRIFLYQTEYFVDQDEYYIPILIHAYITVPISVSVIVFVDNMFAMYIHHACGMFAALSVHLENLYDGESDSVASEPMRSKKIFQRVTLIVKMHSNVLEFSKELESSGAISYLIVLTTNLSMITLCGIVTVMKLGQPSESIRFLAFTLGDIFHLFFSSFQGQKLIDESENVFYSAYMSQWYNLPVEFQRLLLPIMMRSVTPCKVTAGSLYIISMDTFSVMLKNAMSFFTVLSSMR